MEKVFYTIGEVAEILGESASLVRYWTNTFSKFLKPKRNAKGNRLYKKEDIDTIKQIHLLVKTEGMTLEGASAHDDGVARGDGLEAFQVVGQPIDQFVLKADGSVLCYSYYDGNHTDTVALMCGCGS